MASLAVDGIGTTTTTTTNIRKRELQQSNSGDEDDDDTTCETIGMCNIVHHRTDKDTIYLFCFCFTSLICCR